MTVEQALAALASGETSAVELTRVHLAKAAENTHGAWLATDDARALAAAAAVDARRTAGEPLGPLAGVPIGVKDIYCTEGLATTCGSRILDGYVPPYDATSVARLRAAGAVVLGKLDMDEFAMGSSTENTAFGPVKNPWDPSRIPGGSSGGSAVAVCEGSCAAALGTDTGGSIRQPAAMCGVVGLKPTYGRVSRFGVIAFASSLDTPGVLAGSVRGAGAVLSAMAGTDPHDATSSDAPVPAALSDLPRDRDLRGLRIGVPREYFPGDGLAPDVARAVESAIDQLRTLGAEVVEVGLPHTEYAIATYYVLATAEASSNLGRFDGVRYGHRAEASDLGSLYTRTRGGGFGEEVKRRILLGTFVLSAGYYDAYYGRAGRVRTLIRRDFERAFEQVDALVTPTSPTTAFPRGERIDDPLQMYLADVFTISANLAGIPGVSLPCGFDSSGLPIGLQLLGRHFDEAGLLRVAAAYEDATDWGGRSPKPERRVSGKSPAAIERRK